MKHTKLFEEFVNDNQMIYEAKGAPGEIIELVKKIQLGARVTGKKATDNSSAAETDPNVFDTLLKQRLSSFDFLQLDSDSGVARGLSYHYFNVGNYICIKVVQRDGEASIYLQDILNGYRDLKKVIIYGNAEELTDAIFNIISTNINLFSQIADSNSDGDISLSIRKLYSDDEAISIKKAIKYGISGNACANAILLSALEADPADRINDIKNIINVLNQYLKDKDYIKAPQFDDTNPRYFQFPGSNIKTRTR